MRKNKKVKVGIFVALLLLVVGFAAVSTTLSFNGSASVKGNLDDFKKNVKFVADTDANKKATIVDSISTKTTGTASVSADGKTLTFTTPIMDTLNEEVTVSYWIENKSQYNALLGEVTCEVAAAEGTTASTDYITVTPTNDYNNTVLNAGATTDDADTLKVKLAKTYAEETEAQYTITCSLTAQAQEVTN